MRFFIIIILNIIQGVTEFLPISSSGHLVLFYNIFNITENTIALSIIFHFATLLSVVVFYFKDILKLIKKPFCKTNKNLLLSTIFTLIVVLIFKKFMEDSFDGRYLVWGFLITAILLFISENFSCSFNRKVYINNKSNLKVPSITELNISPTQSIIIGLTQGFACFPAVSRSGSTIASGLISGVPKEQVANYSFLLSLPIIIVSMMYQILEFIKNPFTLNFSFLELGIGFVLTFVVGLLSIKVMVDFVKKKRLTIFAFYLVLLALFITLNNSVLFWF